MKDKNKRTIRIAIAAIGIFLCAALVSLISVKESYADKVFFAGHEDHIVPLVAAQNWTAAYQNRASTGDLIAGYFGRSIFDQILSQKKVSGIRIYNASHENGQPVFVLVGVDTEGKDIVQGYIGEGLLPCPPACDGPSALMAQDRKNGLALLAH